MFLRKFYAYVLSKILNRNRNPVWRQKIIAREMKILPKTIRRIIKEVCALQTEPKTVLYRWNKKKSKHLLIFRGKEHYKKILFTSKKIQVIECVYTILQGFLCEGLNEIIISSQWRFDGEHHMTSLYYIFARRALILKKI